MTERDSRAELAAALLREHGMEGVRVSVAGHEAEVAVLSVPADAWERLLADDAQPLVERVKALGFRYVALDLDPLDPTE